MVLSMGQIEQNCVLMLIQIILNKIVYMYNQTIGLMSRVITNGQGDRGSIPGWVISKTPKMELDVALLNTQQYKVRIKGKPQQSRVMRSTLVYLGVAAIEKWAFRLSSTKFAHFTYFHMYKNGFGIKQPTMVYCHWTKPNQTKSNLFKNETTKQAVCKQMTDVKM